MKDIPLKQKKYSLRICVRETIKIDCVYHLSISANNLEYAKTKAKELVDQCRTREGLLIPYSADNLPEYECDFLGGGSSIRKLKSKIYISKTE